MEQKNECMLVTKESFRAIGLKWSGTFAEAGAGGIRLVQAEMKSRMNEIKQVVNPHILLGLSYHVTEDGFTHYSAVEVEQMEDIPDGMASITPPTLTYAKCEHRRGQNIEASYNNIYAWIQDRGYSLYKGDITHYEEYPMNQDPQSEDPEFVIMIPIGT
ncbi:GyrI-like domain-containing protein [Paenibacillus pinisoli]|uniref:GyrI-like domain-containing protein n=1 Tax=Paenibacillus pinisoli TaxID=1276110 RepID=UPI00311EA41F